MISHSQSPKEHITGAAAGTSGREFGVSSQEARSCRPACPVCGGVLMDIRAKLQCTICHTICETCCEGGRG